MIGPAPRSPPVHENGLNHELPHPSVLSRGQPRGVAPTIGATRRGRPPCLPCSYKPFQPRGRINSRAIHGSLQDTLHPPPRCTRWFQNYSTPCRGEMGISPLSGLSRKPRGVAPTIGATRRAGPRACPVLQPAPFRRGNKFPRYYMASLQDAPIPRPNRSIT